MKNTVNPKANKKRLTVTGLFDIERLLLLHIHFVNVELLKY